METNNAPNYAPKRVYQHWREAHPPRMSFEHKGSQTTAEWQLELRSVVRECLGEMPEPVPLDPRQIEEIDCGDHLRQKWIIHSEADFWIPFYLLLPKGSSLPAPAIIALPGHGPGKSRPIGIAETPEEKEKVFGGERDYGLQAVRRGYVAMCPDMRGFGECVDEDHQQINWNESCICSAGRSIMLGRTLLGERVWDVSRSIDYLSSRSDVDPDRIGCMGQSGGGNVTLFAAALEPRIRAAVVSGYLCNWQQSIFGVYHCPCNFVPDLARFADCPDVAGLTAPRPQLFVVGEHDHIFPIAGARAAYEKVKQIYASVGADDRAELYVGPEGHRFYSERAWPFLDRWLGGAEC